MINPKIRHGFVFGLAVLILAAAGITAAVRKSSSSELPAVFAHRGDHRQAPENTLPAFTAAIKNGADGIELDVTQTKDGRLIVVHDDNLERITGCDENVWELTFDEICQLDAGRYAAEAYAGTRIPELGEALELCKGKISLYVELKYNGHETADFVEQVVRLIEEKGMTEECLVASFRYEFASEAKRLNPELRVGLIFSEEETDWEHCGDMDIFSVYNQCLTKTLVERMHAQGKTVYVWTVNEETDIRNCIQWGTDAIVTNDIVAVKAALIK